MVFLWDFLSFAVASAHNEEWDAKRLFERLLGASVGIVGDPEVGREKARIAANVCFIPRFSVRCLLLCPCLPPCPPLLQEPLCHLLEKINLQFTVGVKGSSQWPGWQNVGGEPWDLTACRALPPFSSCFGPILTPLAEELVHQPLRRSVTLAGLPLSFPYCLQLCDSKIVFHLSLPLFLALVICTLKKQTFIVIFKE